MVSGPSQEGGGMAARHLASCLSPSAASGEAEYDPDTDPAVRLFRDAPPFTRLARIASLVAQCTPSEVR